MFTWKITDTRILTTRCSFNMQSYEYMKYVKCQLICVQLHATLAHTYAAWPYRTSSCAVDRLGACSYYVY